MSSQGMKNEKMSIIQSLCEVNHGLCECEQGEQTICKNQ